MKPLLRASLSHPSAPPAALALLGAVAAQSWFHFGAFVAGGDNTPVGFLNPDHALSAARWIWSSSSTPTGGVDYSASLQAFPALIAKPLSLVGLGPAIAQRVFLTLLFASLAPAMFLLLRTLLPRREQLPAVLLGSVFYGFNAALFFAIPNAVILASFALLPLLPALILRGSRSTSWRYPALLAVCALPVGYAFQNPPAVTLVLVASSIALAAGLVERPRKTANRFLLRSALLVGLAGVWWIVPALVTLFGPSRPGVTSAVDPFAWAWTHRRASIGNVLRLTPSWAWPRREYFPYAHVLQSGIFIPLAFLPALLTFTAPIVVGRRPPALAAATAGAALVATVLAKGLHPPLVGLNAALYRHVPGMWLFREPGAKFTLVLSALFAIGIALFAGAFARRAIRWTILGVVAASIAVTSFPIWMGKVVPDSRPRLPSMHVRIPGYWRDAAAFINADPGRTLLLPADGYYQVPYTWGFYGADLIPGELIDAPVVRLMDEQSYGYLAPNAGAYGVLSGLRQAIAGGRLGDAAHLMDVLSIHWILVRRDIDSRFPGRNLLNPSALAGALDASGRFRRVRTFGRLDLYRLRAPERPLVWATTRVLVGDPAQAAGLSERAAVLEQAPAGAPKGLTTSRLLAVAPDAWQWSGSEITTRLQLPQGAYGGVVSWPYGIPLDAEVRSTALGAELYVGPPQLTIDGRPAASSTAPAVLPVDTQRPGLFAIDDRILPLPSAAAMQTTLKVGLHQVSAYALDRALPLADPSFEAGTWGAVGDCNRRDSRRPGEVGLRAVRVAGGSAGRFALELSAREHAACVQQRLSGFVPGDAYKLSLDYRRLSGAAPRLCVWQAGPARCVATPALAVGPGWQRFEEVFRPAAGTQSLTLYLYADGARGGSSELYDNVRVERVAYPPQLALLPSEAAAPPAAPSLRVLHANPTSYRVQVHGAHSPFLLALDETFDRGWQLAGQPGASHVRVNGYANAWLIDRRGTFELTLRYRGQRLVDASRAASVAGLLAAAAWLLLLRQGRARRLARWVLEHGLPRAHRLPAWAPDWRPIAIRRADRRSRGDASGRRRPAARAERGDRR